MLQYSALGSGLKSLQAGRLREAEEQFRYLTQKFPSTDGGYRGLAKVQAEAFRWDLWGAACLIHDECVGGAGPPGRPEAT